MPIGKHLNGHLPVMTYLYDYLETNRDGSPRAIGHDFFNIFTEEEQQNWGAAMDAVRDAAGNNAYVNGKPGITYRHFIISPDPRDDCSLDELRTLVGMWYASVFSHKPGDPDEIKGNYQIAVVYHDDNENQIPHAHVIINNTDITTGKRIQLSNKQVYDMNRKLQVAACELGLTYFDNDGKDAVPAPEMLDEEGDLVKMDDEHLRRRLIARGDEPRVAPVTPTYIEREMGRGGRVSWKQAIRDFVDYSVCVSASADEFFSVLEAVGVEHGDTKKGDDWIYWYVAEPSKQVSGKRLGADYTKDGVTRRITATRRAWSNQGDAKRHEIYIDNVERLFAEVSRSLREDIVVLSDDIPEDMTLHDLCTALKVNEEYQITCKDDYAAAIKDYSIKRDRAKKSGSERAAKNYGRDLRKIYNAQRVAEKFDVFSGIRIGVANTTWRSRAEIRVALVDDYNNAVTDEERAEAMARIEEYNAGVEVDARIVAERASGGNWKYRYDDEDEGGAQPSSPRAHGQAASAPSRRRTGR